MHHLTNVPQDGCEELQIFGLCQVEEGPRTQQNHCDGLREGGQREEGKPKGGRSEGGGEAKGREGGREVRGRPERGGKPKGREGRKRSDTCY